MALTDLDPSAAYGTVTALVAVESGGVPVPGEATLIAASVLAARGDLNLGVVVALAALGAVAGDNAGYWLGRRLGRRVFLHPGPFLSWRTRTLHEGEAFFARRGAAAVFIGRWVAVGRVAVAWLAGAENMSWRAFALVNALGSLTWAASIGVVAYLVGSVGAKWIGIAALALAVTAAARIGVRRHRQKAAVR